MADDAEDGQYTADGDGEYAAEDGEYVAEDGEYAAEDGEYAAEDGEYAEGEQVFAEGHGAEQDEWAYPDGADFAHDEGAEGVLSGPGMAPEPERPFSGNVRGILKSESSIVDDHTSREDGTEIGMGGMTDVR